MKSKRNKAKNNKKIGLGPLKRQKHLKRNMKGTKHGKRRKIKEKIKDVLKAQVVNKRSDLSQNEGIERIV